jgi:hypothetical protein
MSGSSQPSTQVVTQNIDPAMQPYIAYGLSEAQKLYQTPDTPGFFPEQTYVSPSEATQQALQFGANRAVQGNPLLPQSQQTVGQLQSTFNPATAMMTPTASGAYLSGNPFFSGAFNPAANAAAQAFQDQMQQVNSQTSRAGRYGSNAMGQLQDRAMGTFASALTDTAGKLAFQNYGAERQMQEAAQANIGNLYGADYARQLSAAQLGPGMAAADYGDIDRLYQTGQAQESYQQAALADAMQRYNFQQNLPAAKLQSFLSAAYGAPMGQQTTQPIYRNPMANVLGGAALGGALGGSQYGGLGASLGGIAGAFGLLGP